MATFTVRREVASTEVAKSEHTAGGRMPTRIRVRIGVPGLIVGAEWQPDEAERRAAWELYVELVTRIAVVPLSADTGLLREALTSLNSLFTSAREILRRYGPGVAPRRGRKRMSLGVITVAILNGAIRPVLARWHPVLEDYENDRPAGVSRLAHERAWHRAEELRSELNDLRGVLLEASDLLAQVCQATDLYTLPTPRPTPKIAPEGVRAD